MHKSGRKPTRVEKKKITKLGLNPSDYLVVKDSPDIFVLKNRKSAVLVEYEV